MLETDKSNTDEQELAEIAAAQRRLIQLLAKAVAERLANKQTRDPEIPSDWTDDGLEFATAW